MFESKHYKKNSAPKVVARQCCGTFESGGAHFVFKHHIRDQLVIYGISKSFTKCSKSSRQDNQNILGTPFFVTDGPLLQILGVRNDSCKSWRYEMLSLYGNLFSLKTVKFSQRFEIREVHSIHERVLAHFLPFGKLLCCADQNF